MGINMNIDKNNVNKTSNTQYSNQKINTTPLNSFADKMTDLISDKWQDLIEFIEGTKEVEDVEIIEVTDIYDEIPYNSGIFSPDNIEIKDFGGNQGALYHNLDEFLDDPRIMQIATKYFGEGNVTTEDLELLFYRMNSCGCGYIASINTVFQYTLGSGMTEREFEEKFGYPMYKLGTDAEGKLRKDYNTEYLFLDFFLYYNVNHENLTTIEEVYGNTREEMEFNQQKAEDAALSGSQFRRVGADGTCCSEVSEVLSEFLENKGIVCEVSGAKEILPGTDEWYARVEEVKKTIPDVWFDPNIILYETRLKSDEIKQLLRAGNQIVISDENFDLYYPYDKDGNGLLDDIAHENVGAHAMSVVDVLDDGRLVLSSWGNAYIYNPVEFEMNNFAIYNYYPD